MGRTALHVLVSVVGVSLSELHIDVWDMNCVYLSVCTFACKSTLLKAEVIRVVSNTQ